MKRSAGILLSVSSLPSRYGIGCFSESAYQFIDWLKAAGQTYWQILPLGPTSYGDSPYQSFSTFAGNPYYISLESLIQEGLLTKEECEGADFGTDPQRVDYEKLSRERLPLLRLAWQRSHTEEEPAYRRFCREQAWLADYALFMALKSHFGGSPWNEWEEPIRLREETALEKWRRQLAEEICFHQFIQYEFYRQWTALKQYANERGIRIIGDIPIYVAFDSVDTWANPGLFQLDRNHIPKAVAGCPPDGFAADGQLWGNPLYDWGAHRAEHYHWWTARLAHCFRLYDVVRIDHFRGFDEYYSIPYGDKTAVNGHWEQGPGMELFRTAEQVLGKQDVIAEDLGFMTDSVRKLVRDSGFPNMKVLEFAFDARDTGCRNEYLPHNYGNNCIAYTGTHDNQTLISWFASITAEERRMAREYLCDFYTPDDQLHLSFISLIMRSNADVCIIPMQDYLGCDDSCRMNTPSTVGENWKWRMKQNDCSGQLCHTVRRMTEQYGRG